MDGGPPDEGAEDSGDYAGDPAPRSSSLTSGAVPVGGRDVTPISTLHLSMVKEPAIYDMILSRTSLRNLHLSRVLQVPDAIFKITEIVRKLPALRQLTLFEYLEPKSDKKKASFELVSATSCARIFLPLATNDTITFLRVASFRLTDGDLNTLARSMMTNKTLVSLDLCGNSFQKHLIGIQPFSKCLSHHPCLSTLRLDSCGIHDDGLIALSSGLSKSLTLALLSIEDNWFGREGGEALGKALASNASLTSLSVARNRGDSSSWSAGVRHIFAAMRDNATLCSLDVSECSLGPGAVERCSASMESNAALTTLDMHANALGDEGIKAIALVLQLSRSLTLLNVQDNRVGHQGYLSLLTALRYNCTIRSLYFEDPKASREDPKVADMATHIKSALSATGKRFHASQRVEGAGNRIVQRMRHSPHDAWYLNHLYAYDDAIDVALEGAVGVAELRELHIFHNALLSIPPAAFQYEALTYLDVSHNRLQILPPEIELLSSLKWLDVRFNNVQEIPPEIARLHALETLLLNHNDISFLNEALFDLPKLSKLSVYGNRLSRLTEELCVRCKSWNDALCFDGMMAIDMPLELCFVHRLTRLSLANNRIEALPPEIKKLESLVILDVSHNAIQRLPWQMCQLRKLAQLNVAGNPLDQAILKLAEDNRVSEIMEHLSQLRGAKGPHPRARLVVLGAAGCGKSSVLQCLHALDDGPAHRRGKASKGTSSPKMSSKGASSHHHHHHEARGVHAPHHVAVVEDSLPPGGARAVQCGRLVLHPRHASQHGGAAPCDGISGDARASMPQDIVLSTWEFADDGERSDGLHALFHTRATVYVVVFHIVNEPEAAVAARVKSLLFRDAPPIVLVGTGAEDGAASWEFCMAKRESLQSHLHGANNLRGFIPFSSVTGKNVEELARVLYEASASLPGVWDPKPAGYWLMEAQLRTMTRHATTTLSARRTKVAMKKAGLSQERNEVMEAMQYFHRIGLLVHLRGVGEVVLDPNWMVMPLMALHTTKELHSNGTCSKAQLLSLWEAIGYDRAVSVALLHSMQVAGLIHIIEGRATRRKLDSSASKDNLSDSPGPAKPTRPNEDEDEQRRTALVLIERKENVVGEEEEKEEKKDEEECEEGDEEKKEEDEEKDKEESEEREEEEEKKEEEDVEENVKEEKKSEVEKVVVEENDEEKGDAVHQGKGEDDGEEMESVKEDDEDDENEYENEDKEKGDRLGGGDSSTHHDVDGDEEMDHVDHPTANDASVQFDAGDGARSIDVVPPSSQASDVSSGASSDACSSPPSPGAAPIRPGIASELAEDDRLVRKEREEKEWRRQQEASLDYHARQLYRQMGLLTVEAVKLEREYESILWALKKDFGDQLHLEGLEVDAHLHAGGAGDGAAAARARKASYRRTLAPHHFHHNRNPIIAGAAAGDGGGGDDGDAASSSPQAVSSRPRAHSSQGTRFSSMLLSSIQAAPSWVTRDEDGAVVMPDDDVSLSATTEEDARETSESSVADGPNRLMDFLEFIRTERPDGADPRSPHPHHTHPLEHEDAHERPSRPKAHTRLTHLFRKKRVGPTSGAPHQSRKVASLNSQSPGDPRSLGASRSPPPLEKSATLDALHVSSSRHRHLHTSSTRVQRSSRRTMAFDGARLHTTGVPVGRDANHNATSRSFGTSSSTTAGVSGTRDLARLLKVFKRTKAGAATTGGTSPGGAPASAMSLVPSESSESYIRGAFSGTSAGGPSSTLVSAAAADASSSISIPSRSAMEYSDVQKLLDGTSPHHHASPGGEPSMMRTAPPERDEGAHTNADDDGKQKALGGARARAGDGDGDAAGGGIGEHVDSSSRACAASSSIGAGPLALSFVDAQQDMVLVPALLAGARPNIEAHFHPKLNAISYMELTRSRSKRQSIIASQPIAEVIRSALDARQTSHHPREVAGGGGVGRARGGGASSSRVSAHLRKSPSSAMGARDARLHMDILREYHFDALPPTFFPALVVRLLRFARSPVVWRRGLVLRWGGSSALLEVRPAKNRLRLHVTGATAARLLRVVGQQIDGLCDVLLPPGGADGDGGVSSPSRHLAAASTATAAAKACSDATMATTTTTTGATGAGDVGDGGGGGDDGDSPAACGKSALGAFAAAPPKVFVPCCHCLDPNLPHRRPFLFPFHAILGALSQSKHTVMCMHPENPDPARGYPVYVDALAPDASLAVLRKHEVDFSSLELRGVVAKGSGSLVHLAKMMRGAHSDGDDARRSELVAVKKYKMPSDITDEELLVVFNEFRSEALILSQLSHPNIVPFKGFCRNPFSLVLEYLPDGNLFNLLRETREAIARGSTSAQEHQHTSPPPSSPSSPPLAHPAIPHECRLGALQQRLREAFPGVLEVVGDADALLDVRDWRVRLGYAIDASRGMAYLHGLSPPIIHCDLKSANILVHGRTAKVTDFGLSVNTVSTRGRRVDNPFWLAVEVMVGEEYTQKSDVYSFGVVLWELLTLKMPFASANIGFLAQLEKRIVDGLRPEMPSEPVARLYDDGGAAASIFEQYCALVTQCWQRTPSARPSFGQITCALESMLAKVSIYPGH